MLLRRVVIFLAIDVWYRWGGPRALLRAHLKIEKD